MATTVLDSAPNLGKLYAKVPSLPGAAAATCPTSTSPATA